MATSMVPARVDRSRCRYPLREFTRSFERVPYSAPHTLSACAESNAFTNVDNNSRIKSGLACANCSCKTAGIKEVATVHDKKTYGQGLVDAFSQEFKKLGGTIVAAETINPDDDKYDAVISKIKPSNPKAVYYGGEYPQAGPFSQQMKAAGLNVPLMGGDGIYSGEYVKLAGATSEGDLSTSVGAPTDTLESAKSFVDSYAKAGYSEAYEAYGAYAFDAANAIIAALKTSLKDAASADAARQATVQAMSSVSFDGVTGKVAFDEYGDTTSRVLTVYGVKGGKWEAVNTAEFK